MLVFTLYVLFIFVYNFCNWHQNIRSALHSNVTFSRLAEKLDIFAVSDKVLHSLTSKTFGEGSHAPMKTRPQIKATADLFETVIGLYHLDHGFEALCKWVNELYQPLVEVAAAECFRWYERVYDSSLRISF